MKEGGQFCGMAEYMHETQSQVDNEDTISTKADSEQ
jgi:hypothetical protein